MIDIELYELIQTIDSKQINIVKALNNKCPKDLFISFVSVC
jgi:hypothetical protein